MTGCRVYVFRRGSTGATGRSERYQALKPVLKYIISISVLQKGNLSGKMQTLGRGLAAGIADLGESLLSSWGGCVTGEYSPLGRAILCFHV
jgi:hypothetical protein